MLVPRVGSATLKQRAWPRFGREDGHFGCGSPECVAQLSGNDAPPAPHKILLHFRAPEGLKIFEVFRNSRKGSPLIFFSFPQYFSDDEITLRQLYYNFYKSHADIFFAVSEFTKSTMVEYLGIPEEKIIVTPLAADPNPAAKFSQRILSWVESFGRYWIYPAKPWEHKNHRAFFSALACRAEALKSSGVRILLTGGISEMDRIKLNNLLIEFRLTGVVETIGFIDEEMLQALIMRSEYLFFPSLFEGFGITPKNCEV